MPIVETISLWIAPKSRGKFVAGSAGSPIRAFGRTLALTILSNRLAARSILALRTVSAAHARSLERLSSGQRINRASDDAAGTSIAKRLDSERLLLTAALRNAYQAVGIGVTRTSAMDEQLGILFEMRDLAVRAMNGTVSLLQRKALNDAFKSFGQEIERIARTAKFNGFDLLIAHGVPISVQVTTTGQSHQQILMREVDTTLHYLGLGEGYDVEPSLTGDSMEEAIDHSADAREKVEYAIANLMEQRGVVAADIGRFEAAAQNLSVQHSTITSAYEQSIATDIPEEAAEATKYAILKDIVVALLAQANQAPSQALALLM